MAIIEITDKGLVSYIDLNKKELPREVREGDVLEHTQSGWEIDQAATYRRRTMIKDRLNKLGI